MKRTCDFLKLSRLVLALLAASCAALHAATVNWDGSTDTTWTAGSDATSWSGATFVNGDHVLFGNTGVGTVTLSGAINAGNLSFTNTSGTYLFDLTAGNTITSTGNMSVSGGGTVQFGNTTNSPGSLSSLVTWTGTTSVTGGSTLTLTRPGNIGGSGQTVTLDNGTLRVAADNAQTYTMNNPIAIGSGGAKIEEVATGNVTVMNFTGNVTGSSSLTLLQTLNATSATRNAAMRFAGTNTSFTGPVTMVGQRDNGSFRFASTSSLFSGSSGVRVTDGAVMSLEFAVAAADLTNVSFVNGGGLGVNGASGSFTSLSNPLSYVSKGGTLILDNLDAINADRWTDSAAVALDDQRFFMRSRNANTSAVTETIGALSFSRGARLTMASPNSNNSGADITAASLTVSGNAGDTLTLDTASSTSNFGTTASTSALIVTGSKPTVTNGMISPSVQMYGGVNAAGDFATFSGNDLITATANYAAGFNSGSSTEIANVTATTTLSANETVHAVRLGAALTINSGVTLNVSSGGLIVNGTSINGTGTVNFGSVPAFLGSYNAAGQSVINAKISGSGGLTILGASQSVDLANAGNDFTGGLFINGGNVALNVASAANGNNVTVNGFGRLMASLNGGTVNIGGLSGAGKVAADFQGTGSTNTLNISPTSGSFTFDGAFSNGDGGRVLAITKSGAGTQVLTNNGSTHTGLTTVAEGILEVKANNALGSTAAGTTVSGGGALRLNNVAYTAAEALTLNGTGVSGGGALVNSGTSSYAGQITAATNATISTGSGTLTVTGGLVKNGTTLTVTGGGRLNVNSTGISGASANSDLVVDNATLVVNAASNYNGPTTVQNSGTLVANAAVTTTQMTVSANSTLNGTSSITTAGGSSYVYLNGALVVGDSTLLTPGASVLDLQSAGASGSTVMGTAIGSSLYFDLFQRGGDLSATASAADYIRLFGVLDASAGGTLVLGNPTGLSGFAAGDQWRLFDLIGVSGGAITGSLSVDYSALSLAPSLTGNFNSSTGIFSLSAVLVPEPSRALLMLGGLVGLGMRRRRVVA